LKEKYGLHKTRYIGITKQLGIFLYIIVIDLFIRKLAERFQRNTETINRVYHKIILCFLKLGLYESAVQYIPIDYKFHDNLFYNKSYYPYFKDYVRAVDSTKIFIFLPAKKQTPFRDRKSNLT
jgi:hypothetical protein